MQTQTTAPDAKNPKTPKATASKKQKAKETVKQAITDQKDLLYIYPKDANTLETRKAFRRGLRRKIDTFNKQLKELKDEKAKKELIAAFREEVKGKLTPKGMTKKAKLAA